MLDRRVVKTRLEKDVFDSYFKLTMKKSIYQ